jgi:hypothetical protein
MWRDGSEWTVSRRNSNNFSETPDAIWCAQGVVTMNEIGFSPVNGKPFVVDNKIKSRHTAKAVLKQAGPPKGFDLKTPI